MAGKGAVPPDGPAPGRPVPGLFDTHAHLDDGRFAEDRDAVLSRARAAGIQAVLTCGSDLASSRAAVQLARRSDAGLWIRAAVGIHPHEVGEAGGMEAALDELRRLAAEPEVVAVGEIGLDFHYALAPRPVQLKWLRAQLDLARAVGLPVVLHTRDAVDDVLDMLEALTRGSAGAAGATGAASARAGTEPTAAAQLLGVLHCFTGTLEQARRALHLGFYLGVGGVITFAGAADVRAVIAKTPVERLLLETDAPYLAPAPHRGRRNEPALMVHTAQRLAELLGLPLPTLAEVTSANARRLFDRASSPEG